MIRLTYLLITIIFPLSLKLRYTCTKSNHSREISTGLHQPCTPPAPVPALRVYTSSSQNAPNSAPSLYSGASLPVWIICFPLLIYTPVISYRISFSLASINVPIFLMWKRPRSFSAGLCTTNSSFTFAIWPAIYTLPCASELISRVK